MARAKAPTSKADITSPNSAPRNAPAWPARSPVFSVAHRLRPRHGELITATNELVAVEMEPQRDQEVEHHHRDQLRAEAEEDREERHCAEAKQHDRRQRVERVRIAAPDGAE